MQPDPVLFFSIASSTLGRVDYYLGGNGLDIISAIFQFILFWLMIWLFVFWFDFIFQFFN